MSILGRVSGRQLRRVLFALLCLLPFLLPSTFVTSSSSSSSSSGQGREEANLLTPLQAVERATDLFNDGSVIEAISLIEGAALQMPSSPLPHFYLGAIHQRLGKNHQAVMHYSRCLQLDPSHVDALNNLGKVRSDLGEWQVARAHFESALAVSPSHTQASINLGLLLHSLNLFQQASATYALGIERATSSEGVDELHYNLAVTLQHMGDVVNSVEHYRLAIQARQQSGGADYSEAWLNLAAMHHKHGTLADAVWHYQRSLAAVVGESRALKLSTEDDLHLLKAIAHDDFYFEMCVMILNNAGQALTQMGRVAESVAGHRKVLALMQLRLEGVAKDDKYETAALDDNILHTRAHVFRSAKMSCSWSEWRAFDQLLQDIGAKQMANGNQSALLPFDTLGLPVDPAWRKEVAVLHARELSELSDRLDRPTAALRDESSRRKAKKLKVGYICYDFNDHPTAHLAEGLFLWHNRSAVVDFEAYNYGKDDNSTYRKNIVRLVGGKAVGGGNFVELSHLGHDDAAAVVGGRRPDILIDMQGFTLGGRPEISARNVAPIQVNFLIFPGTSGASFVHYLVGDKFVTPPEHSRFYTEKLALMPNSYQINYYARHVDDAAKLEKERGSEEWVALRKKENLPASEEAFVFANFNKQDKLEPYIWGVWMDILSRAPNSVLWLLEPSHRYMGSGVVENLQMEAEARGVRKERLIFAKRVGKREHLIRLGIADLFLDSFFYGAHSTATDSLMGGLPVLSVGGGSFARRVGISLLKNLGESLDELLLVNSAKEFADAAVSLATAVAGKSVLQTIKKKLGYCREGALFDTETYTKDFERLNQAMYEVKNSCDGKADRSDCQEFMHVILSARSASG